jgi:hypothetical protein
MALADGGTGFHFAQLILFLVFVAIIVLLIFGVRAFVRGVRRGMRGDGQA